VPLHEQPPYLAGGASLDPGGLGAGFPVAGALSRQGINLPSGTALTPAEVATVCAALRELANAAA
jgi:dTDP-4-amino-4,6-dideoxygalactose transaminase